MSAINLLKELYLDIIKRIKDVSGEVEDLPEEKSDREFLDTQDVLCSLQHVKEVIQEELDDFRSRRKSK